jgi:hypothetical protein
MGHWVFLFLVVAHGEQYIMFAFCSPLALDLPQSGHRLWAFFSPHKLLNWSPMKLTWKDYAEIAGDFVGVCVAFLLGHWLGFALAIALLALVYGYKALMLLQTIRDVLLSRLSERCALCHREILDEPGILDHDFEEELKIYHEGCAERLDAMKLKGKHVAEASRYRDSRTAEGDDRCSDHIRQQASERSCRYSRERIERREEWAVIPGLCSDRSLLEQRGRSVAVA